MATPPPPYNYSINAVAANTATALFAPSKAQNLPTAIVCPTISLPVPNNTATAIPASVFSAGSGVYTLFCDVAGTTGYDLASSGRVTIVSGAITNSVGFICQQVQAPVYVVGPPIAVTQAVAALANTGVLGAQSPAIFQTSGGALTYSIIATKIANV